MIFLTIILCAIPIILIAALFTHRGFTVEQEITIEKPVLDVFNYLKFLKNQDQYNAWLTSDPKMSKDFTGTDGNVGFIYAWHSRNSKIGKAQQEIIEIIEPKKIVMVIRFEKPFVSRALNYFELTPVSDNETKVRWFYKGNTKPYYFLRVAHLLFRLKKAVSTRMQASLANLKTVLESS